MPKQKSYIFTSLLFLVVLTGGSILAVVPAHEVWQAASSWAQDAGTQQPEGKDKAVEAEPDPGDILAVSKRQENVPDDVVHHSYSDGEDSYEQTYVTRSYLLLTSKTETITIRRIIGNRGNCEIGDYSGLTVLGRALARQLKDAAAKDAAARGVKIEEPPVATLKFGQSVKLEITCTSLIEAEIQTDKGVMTFTWDN